MTLTRYERRAARRASLFFTRRARATGPKQELAAATDFLRGWAADQIRRDRPEHVRAAAAAVAQLPHQIEEASRGAR